MTVCVQQSSISCGELEARLPRFRGLTGVTDFLFVRGRSGSFIWSAGLKYDINQQEEISAVCFNVSFLRRLCHCSAVGQLENHWCFKLLVHLAHRITK